MITPAAAGISGSLAAALRSFALLLAAALPLPRLFAASPLPPLQGQSTGRSADPHGAFATLHVSPQGNDANPGSESRPFRTVEKALERTRALRDSMAGDIIILMRGGTYPVSKPIVLDEGHGGKDGFKVRIRQYRDEKPVLEGGKPVTGWKSDGKGMYRAYVGKGLVIRQLYSQEGRLLRARSGDLEPSGDLKLDTSGRLQLDPKGKFANLAAWKNLRQIEIVGKNQWRCFRGGLDSVRSGTVFLKEPFLRHARSELLNATKFTGPSWIENALELLDEPGEWYYDSASGYIHLKSASAGRLSFTRIRYGTTERLMAAGGRADAPLRGLEISGLAFAHTGWADPSADFGFVTMQVTHLGTAGFSMRHMPAALTVENATDVSVQDNLFIHLGGDALRFGKGVKDSRVERNTILDASGSGIVLGEVGDEPERRFPVEAGRVSGNVIGGNYISRVGQEFFGSVGIFLGVVERTRVENNELYDLPSTGISLGWGWGSPNYSNTNRIRANKIGAFGRVLNDNGGVYVLGPQPDGRVDSNFIYGQGSRYGGIYLDNGANGVLVEGNVVHSSGHGERWIYVQFNGNKARGNTIRGNFFQWPNWRQCSNEAKRPGDLVSACEDNTIIGDGGSDVSANRALVSAIMSAAGINDAVIRERSL